MKLYQVFCILKFILKTSIQYYLFRFVSKYITIDKTFKKKLSLLFKILFSWNGLSLLLDLDLIEFTEINFKF